MTDETLHEIDALGLARETVRDAWKRIFVLARDIDPSWEAAILSLPNQRGRADEDTVLGKAVRALTLYAQDSSSPPGSHVAAAERLEHLLSVTAVCTWAVSPTGQPQLGTPLGLVIAAAVTREGLEQGKPVRATWLAALAGCSHVRIKQLVQDGTLRSSGRGLVRADDARRWLAARGIKVERRAEA